jgi:hypothetical protein
MRSFGGGRPRAERRTQMRQRIRNYRATWPYQVHEPVSGNFVPVNSAAYIQVLTPLASITPSVTAGSLPRSFRTRPTALWWPPVRARIASPPLMRRRADRSHGGGSIADGQLEIMIHRRLLYDDSRGVGEPLNETGVSGLGLVVRVTQRASFAPVCCVELHGSRVCVLVSLEGAPADRLGHRQRPAALHGGAAHVPTGGRLLAAAGRLHVAGLEHGSRHRVSARLRSAPAPPGDR